MYFVTRNGRNLKTIYASSYEAARQALRRHIRRQVKCGKANVSEFAGSQPWDSISRNPVNFTRAGFRIVRA